MGSIAGRALLRAVAVAFIVATPLSIAQQYPIRALRVVVPFAPGGSTDVLARIMGQRLAESLGPPVIIDNRPAGGGTTGTDLVAKGAAGRLHARDRIDRDDGDRAGDVCQVAV